MTSARVRSGRIRWRAQGYIRIGTAIQRLPPIPRAIVAGLWLGLLSRVDLHHVDEDFYSEHLSTYASDEHNRRGLFEWERVAIEAHFNGRRNILVGAAGTGRELLALRKLGFCPFGFECHPELVEIGREFLAREHVDAELEYAPRDTCPPIAPEFEAAIVGWSGYTLIGPSVRRVAFLRQLRRLIDDGAPVLLSFHYRLEDDSSLRICHWIASILRCIRRDEPAEFGDSLAPNYLHFFSEEEIRGETAAAGLRLVSYSTSGYGHAIAHAG
jgi:hypothetical protein